MEWRGEGILLSVRRHGETAAIITVFSAERGRHLGLVHGGASRKKASFLQPGAQLALTWRARLEDQLGTFTAEPIRSRAGLLLDDRQALSALNATVALLSAYLPEREPYPSLYDSTVAMLDVLGRVEHWATAYAMWELGLLEALGYGLDLSNCAVTGQTQELVWVSPKSGRAVSRAAGDPYADRLLPLPDFLRLGGRGTPEEIAAALRLSGFFLSKWVAPAVSREEPIAARERLTAVLGERTVPRP